MPPKIASWRVVGPHSEGPWEVRAETGLGAVQKVFTLAPELHNEYQGIGEPRGPHGPVVAYKAAGNAQAVEGAFDVTFLCWETVLSVTESAERIGRDPSRIRVLIREGRLPAHREETSRGTTYWLTAADVDAFTPKAHGRPPKS